MRTILSLPIAMILSASAVIARAEVMVVPNDRADQSGNLSKLGGFGSLTGFQTAYGAGNFSGPVLINGIAFRADENSNGRSFDMQIPELTIRMSTYHGKFPSVGQKYDQNKSDDDTMVFNGAVHWPTTDRVGTAPNPFDLKVTFSQPFRYDPGQGDLLMSFERSGDYIDSVEVDVQRHYNEAIGWTEVDFRGYFEVMTIVTQFDMTPVPEPSALALAAFGSLGWFFRFVVNRRAL